MIRTTIAHTAAYLKTFFFEGEDALLNNNNDPGVVVYGDSDSYFNKRKDDRLTFPGLIFTLTQISQRNGPSKPTWCSILFSVVHSALQACTASIPCSYPSDRYRYLTGIFPPMSYSCSNTSV